MSKPQLYYVFIRKSAKGPRLISSYSHGGGEGWEPKFASDWSAVKKFMTLGQAILYLESNPEDRKNLLLTICTYAPDGKMPKGALASERHLDDLLDMKNMRASLRRKHTIQKNSDLAYADYAKRNFIPEDDRPNHNPRNGPVSIGWAIRTSQGPHGDGAFKQRLAELLGLDASKYSKEVDRSLHRRTSSRLHFDVLRRLEDCVQYMDTAKLEGVLGMDLTVKENCEQAAEILCAEAVAGLDALKVQIEKDYEGDPPELDKLEEGRIFIYRQTSMTEFLQDWDLQSYLAD